jgi:hypothetical protein
VLGSAAQEEAFILSPRSVGGGSTRNCEKSRTLSKLFRAGLRAHAAASDTSVPPYLARPVVRYDFANAGYCDLSNARHAWGDGGIPIIATC